MCRLCWKLCLCARRACTQVSCMVFGAMSPPRENLLVHGSLSLNRCPLNFAREKINLISRIKRYCFDSMERNCFRNWVDIYYYFELIYILSRRRIRIVKFVFRAKFLITYINCCTIIYIVFYKNINIIQVFNSNKIQTYINFLFKFL